ncbi:glycosyltransferase family 2 protein [Candidatus Beckwithbacteria bacterium]|nr:glycosyltransferase family 2 protein [Candidatus Beckwithbacteria bacterium]
MKNKKIEISIIITYYNLGQYIDEAIKSCFSQTFANFEIILVNDGSNEKKSLEKLSELKTKYKDKIQFIDQENQGVAKARNKAIQKASGKFICCLDSDDKLAVDYLQKTYQILNNNSNLAFVTSFFQTFGQEQKLIKPYDYNLPRLLAGNQIHVSSIFRKNLWQKVAGYDEKLSGYQDWQLWIKLTCLGYKWEVVKEPLFFYRIRRLSMLKNSDKKRFSLLIKIILANHAAYLKNFYKVIYYWIRIILKKFCKD